MGTVSVYHAAPRQAWLTSAEHAEDGSNTEAQGDLEQRVLSRVSSH